MVLDPAWEAAHAAREWGKYPREDLIRFVAKHYYGAPDRGCVRFLDLGCGAGAATWYLAREKFEVVAVDGSESAIRRLAARVNADRLNSVLMGVEDITNPRIGHRFSAAGRFDCVLDICTTQHLEDFDQVNVFTNAFTWLKPGGRIFSVRVAFGTDLRLGHRADTHIDPLDPIRAANLLRPFGFDDIAIELITRAGPDGIWSEWIITGRKP